MMVEVETDRMEVTHEYETPDMKPVRAAVQFATATERLDLAILYCSSRGRKVAVILTAMSNWAGPPGASSTVTVYPLTDSLTPLAPRLRW